MPYPRELGSDNVARIKTLRIAAALFMLAPVAPAAAQLLVYTDVTLIDGTGRPTSGTVRRISDEYVGGNKVQR